MKKILFYILQYSVLIHVSYSLNANVSEEDTNSKTATTTSITSLITNFTTVTSADLDLNYSDVLSTTITEFTTITESTTIPVLTSTTEEIITNNILMKTHNSNASELGSSSCEFSDLKFYCYCNIIPLICDTNCCCDKQCSEDVLQIFNCQNNTITTTTTTRFTSLQYEHELSSCKMNDGWLCIFRANVEHTKKKNEKTNLLFSSNYKWPNGFIYIKESKAENFSFYKYGEPLILVNAETNHFYKLDIPYAFNSPYCKLKMPIRYLVQQTTHCLINDMKAENRFKHTFLALLRSTKLLNKPKILGISKEQKENDLIDLQIRRCIQENSLEHCHILTSPASNEIEYKFEHAFLKEINFKILHNFTHIEAITLELKESSLNLTENQNKLRTLWRTYKVQFILSDIINKQQKPEANIFNIKYEEQAISGALGYTLGAPIIFAKILSYKANETSINSKKNIVLDYFYGNDKHLLKNSALRMFNRRNGYCCKTNKRTEFINYGVNALKQCKLSFHHNELIDSDKSNKSNGINYTNICINLQGKAWQSLYFSGDNITTQQRLDIYISRFGKPKPELENWTVLQMQHYDTTSIAGFFNSKTQSFTCQNMLISIFYEFFMDVSDEYTNPQLLIEEATLSFGSRQNLEFPLNKSIEVPLTISVMFYNRLQNFSSCSISVTVSKAEIILAVLWCNILVSIINKYNT